MKLTSLRTYTTAIILLLSCLFITTANADDNKKKEEKKEKKEKKETKYDKLFKNKLVDKATSKFITIYKTDGKLYFELPLKYLKKEMLLGGTISSVTDPTYITVGMKNFNPIDFYFEKQDSSIVMKTPNTIVYQDKNTSLQMKEALALSYRDPIFTGFKIEAYNNDSTAVVFDVTSLLGKPNTLLPIIPKKNGDFTINGTPKSEMSYTKAIKSFDDNLTITNDFNYNITASILSIPLSSDIPNTIGVTYSLMLLPKSNMRPRIIDSRIGVASTRKIFFKNDMSKSDVVFLAHRWKLIPRNKHAYAKGKLSLPEKPIRFYIDDTFPQTWKEPIKKGVLAWNKAFEKAGFKNAIEVADFPQNDKNFDPDDLAFSCIRYVPNKAENPFSASWVNPATGEIINASVFINSNIRYLLHKWRFVETAATDPEARSGKLSDKLFAEGLTMVVAQEIGKTLGLLPNPGASSTYSVENLRRAQFTKANGLTPSIMDDVHYNYIAQPTDHNATLCSYSPGMYDCHTIEWDYRYFDTEKISASKEAKILEDLTDKRVKDPRYRYYREKTILWDPRVQPGALGDDPIKRAKLGIQNLNTIQKNILSWVKNDEDSRIKEKLYLSIAQQYYAFFKQVMSLVGGIYLNDMKESSGVPRYQVVPKNKQREALLWALAEACHFKHHANTTLEKRGFIAISYYDQLLEFIGYELMGARTRVAVASHLDNKAYTQKEFFDDLFNGIFKSVYVGKAPSQEERILQQTFLTYSRSVIAKSSGKSSIGSKSLKDSNNIIPTTVGYGNPTSSLAPTITPAMVDRSDIYFYSSLLKLKPMLEKCLKKNLPNDAKAHYQMLLFKVNKELEDK